MFENKKLRLKTVPLVGSLSRSDSAVKTDTLGRKFDCCYELTGCKLATVSRREQKVQSGLQVLPLDYYCGGACKWMFETVGGVIVAQPLCVCVRAMRNSSRRTVTRRPSS